MVVAWLGYIVEVLGGGEGDKERSLHVMGFFFGSGQCERWIGVTCHRHR